jgi:hypothetical protein
LTSLGLGVRLLLLLPVLLLPPVLLNQLLLLLLLRAILAIWGLPVVLHVWLLLLLFPCIGLLLLSLWPGPRRLLLLLQQLQLHL